MRSARLRSPRHDSWLAPRLTREAARDDIHDSTPRAAVEGSEICPNRCIIHGFLRRHARSQDRTGIGFVLNAADDASISERQIDAEIESPASGADGQNVDGTCTHKLSGPHRSAPHAVPRARSAVAARSPQ